MGCLWYRQKLFLLQYEDLGEEKSLGLPVFHSFTRCDSTSVFTDEAKSQHGKYGIVLMM